MPDNQVYNVEGLTMRELREMRDALESHIDKMPGGIIRLNALTAHVKVCNAIAKAENTLVWQYQNSE